AGTGIVQEMTTVRRAVALDLLERLVAVPGVVPVLLSDDGPLLKEARKLGCRVRVTEHTFDWLGEVQKAIRAEARDSQGRVLVMGGCAAPFLQESHLVELMSLPVESGMVWQNNRLSPDMVLFAPAQAVFQVQTCATDNEFGYALEQQAGLQVHYLPQELAYTFDVDTPLDALLAAMAPEAGDELKQAVGQIEHRVPLQEALEVLRRTDYPDVALLGRVHPVVAERFGQQAGIRLRLYSEERGMKALGRIERGEVRSLVAELAEAVGWRRFFALLGEQASCAFFDTRVVFAHRGSHLTEHDRFAADLMLAEEIADPWLREMVLAAREAPIPVVMGGQSLVSGGLQVLLRAARAL
ncbi:MAG: hypothetical protein ACXVOI_06560, partial [Tumebacillaceae bacterium]